MTQDPYKYFRLEARELVDRIHAGVLEIDRNLGRSRDRKSGPIIARGSEAGSDRAPVRGLDADIVKSLLRATHTLKGAARAVRLPEIAEHAHAIEDALEPFRDVGGVTRAAIDAILPRLDDVELRVRALGRPPDAASPPAAAPSVSAVAAVITAASSPPPEPVAIDEAARSLRAEIGDMDEVLDGVAEAHAAVGTLRRLADDVEQAHRLAEVTADQLGPHAAGAPAEAAHTAAAQIAGALGALDRGLDAAIEKLDRELRAVHDAAEQLRLVPASALFTALERSARDAARALGKEVAFVGSGGELRLDAHVLTAVQPALVQLVRNAIAHGIELPAERLRAGKPRAGRIAIEVERRARRVAFACRDDGRGVDVEVLRQAAIRRGALEPDAPPPTAGELVELLLRGGISTAATVTGMSGRGVGLDVVRDAMARLGGRVAVSTEPRAGTAFELEVPVSLASVHALAVEDTGTIAAIPLPAVRQAVRVAAADIIATPAGSAIVHDGAVTPFLRLASVLGRAAPPRAGAWTAVIVEDRGQRIALGVGRLIGATTIVVRPLPELAPADAVVGGASLDADGVPQLVLDPAGLVATRPRRLAAPEARRPRILVIDDSVTTRMLEQSILESAGYQVDLAVSAEDGLVRARAARYALFLVDVEMPGMDGFSFIEHIQSDPALRDTPAILVTSRASPSDRARGHAVGARGYIAKGAFDQVALLDQIARLVA